MNTTQTQKPNNEVKSKFKGYCTSGAAWSYCYVCNNNFCTMCNNNSDHEAHAKHDAAYRV